MKSNPISPTDLANSVIAVPPLALNANLQPDPEANRRILAHLRGGGVTSCLYGGNANFYHLSLSGYGDVLDVLEDVAPPDCWLIPSIGPDFGKAMDQLDVIRERAYPTAMLLPMQAPVTPEGVASGCRRLADRLGKPIIVYVKFENYLTPRLLQELHADGVVCSIKYAIERPDPKTDDFLAELVQRVGTERLVSGIGERPVVDHLGHFGLQGFTSGSVCIAPRISMAFKNAVQNKDWGKAETLWQHFVPMENLRDEYSPIRVLHEAVRLAGIADTGPMLPMLSNIDDPALCARIEAAATNLLQANAAL